MTHFGAILTVFVWTVKLVLTFQKRKGDTTTNYRCIFSYLDTERYLVFSALHDGHIYLTIPDIKTRFGGYGGFGTLVLSFSLNLAQKWRVSTPHENLL